MSRGNNQPPQQQLPRTPVAHIPPVSNNPGQKNTVYKDNPLPIEYAFAYRKKVNAGDPQKFVFIAQSLQEAGGILQILSQIKQKQGIDQQQQVPSSLVQQGYMNQQRQVNPTFAGKICDTSNRPKIEIILNGAVLLMNEKGTAYIHSKGEAIDQQLMKPLQDNWLRFYDKNPSSEQQKQQLVQSRVHFHTVKQQTDDYSSVDWGLSNLDILSDDVNASEDILKNAQKKPRSPLVTSISGQPDPRDASKRLALVDKSNEHENKQQWQERDQQRAFAETRHGIFSERAASLKQKAEEQGRQHAFRQDPRNSWVEVFIAAPPKYLEDAGDVNKMRTTRDDSSGIENTFELKQGNVVAKSTKGEVTYMERFTRIAEDIRVMFLDSLSPPIVINGVKPASKEQECKEAFEKVFGVGSVQVNNPASVADSSSAIHAAKPGNS